MRRIQKAGTDFLKFVSILGICFLISMILQEILPSQSLVSMIFVLAVFLISLGTDGYFLGHSGIHCQRADR